MSIDSGTASLLVGGLTAAVTVGGWIVLHHFTIRREEQARKDAGQKELEARRAADMRADHVKRLEILLKQTESKISEFYGPMDGLVHQIWATWEVKERMRPYVDDATYQKVSHYIADRYFSPMHERIRTLMATKMHLIEGVALPPSFYEYVKHSVMENIQVNMWNERQIDTSVVPGLGWPADFPRDVQTGLKAAMERYEGILAELRGGERMPQDSSFRSDGVSAPPPLESLLAE